MTRQSIPRLRKITWKYWIPAPLKRRDYVELVSNVNDRGEAAFSLSAQGAVCMKIINHNLPWPLHGQGAVTWLIEWPIIADRPNG